MAVSMIGPKFYAWDSDTGKPLAFGKVYTYAAGTNTPKPTWQSEDGAVANTNPVILNGAGYADIYLRGRYKIVVKDADDVEVWTADPVSDASSLLQPWIEETTATQVAPNQFKVTGNKTDVFRYGRSVKMDDQVIVYGTVLKSEYLSGETFVTIDAVDILTSQLSRAWASLVDLESLLPVLKDEAGTTLVDAVTESLATFQPRMEQRFNLLMAASGYEFLATYQQGIEVTEYNQVLRDAAGELWRAAATTTLPYTTTGAGLPEGGNFVPAGDAVLRQALANPDKGAAMVARGVVAVDSIADLLALPEEQRKEGLRYLAKGYHAGSNIGSGEFYWDATSTATDNGGTVLEVPGVVTGRFVRRFEGAVDVTWFGAKGDAGVTDDSQAIQQALNSHRHVYIPPLTFRCDSMINLSSGKVLELKGGAVLRRYSAYSASEDPVVWIAGSEASLFGTGLASSTISSENRCPKGVVRLGHKDMTESHANVTYCSLRDMTISGPLSYGQTSGAQDVALYVPNPQIGGLVNYLHNITGLRLQNANYGIWLHGWANANTISNIQFYRLGSRLDNGGAAIFDNGSLDNAVSDCFFHSSPNSTGILFGALDNTSNGGSTHSTTDSSYKGFICEQGGTSAKAIVSDDSVRNCYIEIKDNVAGGYDIDSEFRNRNTLITRSSFESRIVTNVTTDTITRTSRRGEDEEQNAVVSREYYSSLGSLLEGTQYKIIELSLNSSTGVLVNIEYSVNQNSNLSWTTAGVVTYAVRRSGTAAPEASAIKYNRLPGGSFDFLEPKIDGNSVSLCFRVPSNGTSTTTTSVYAKISVVGIVNDSPVNIFTTTTKETVSGLAALVSPISI